jgi:hypothetical protein
MSHPLVQNGERLLQWDSVPGRAPPIGYPSPLPEDVAAAQEHAHPGRHPRPMAVHVDTQDLDPASAGPATRNSWVWRRTLSTA